MFYIMLTGYAPFEIPEWVDEQFQAVISGDVKLMLRAVCLTPGVEVSHAALEVLGCMLCPEAKRHTADQMLDHPWFREDQQQANPVSLSCHST